MLTSINNNNNLVLGENVLQLSSSSVNEEDVDVGGLTVLDNSGASLTLNSNNNNSRIEGGGGGNDSSLDVNNLQHHNHHQHHQPWSLHQIP